MRVTEHRHHLSAGASFNNQRPSWNHLWKSINLADSGTHRRHIIPNHVLRGAIESMEMFATKTGQEKRWHNLLLKLLPKKSGDNSPSGKPLSWKLYELVFNNYMNVFLGDRTENEAAGALFHCFDGYKKHFQESIQKSSPHYVEAVFCHWFGKACVDSLFHFGKSPGNFDRDEVLNLISESLLKRDLPEFSNRMQAALGISMGGHSLIHQKVCFIVRALETASGLIDSQDLKGTGDNIGRFQKIWDELNDNFKFDVSQASNAELVKLQNRNLPILFRDLIGISESPSFEDFHDVMTRFISLDRQGFKEIGVDPMDIDEPKLIAQASSPKTVKEFHLRQ